LFGSGRREACIAVAVLLVAAVAAQARLLLGLATPVPQTGEGAANADIVLPALADAAAVVQNGEWPLWNPFARFGEPFQASGVQPLYPGYWPLLFFGAFALPWVLALHSALACTFMFRWLRVLPASRFSAFLGAAAWGLGVWFQFQLQRLPEAAAAAWLPLAFEGLWRLTRPGRNPAFAAVAAVGFAAMFATGATALPALAAGSAVFLAGVNLMKLPRADRPEVLRHLAVATVGALLLCAPAWLYALQHSGALVEGSSQPRTELASRAMLLASVNALPHAPGSDALELALFPGTAILMMLLLSLVRPSPAQPRWPWFALGLLGLFVAADGPWTELLHERLGLGAGRPGASLCLLQLAVLVLACLGLDGFLEAPFRRKAMAGAVGVAGIVVGVAVLGVAFLRPEPAVAWFAEAFDPTGKTPLALAGVAFSAAIVPTGFALAMLGGVLASWRSLGILRFKVALSAVAFTELLYLAWESAPARAVREPVDIVGAGSARVLAVDDESVERLHRGRAPAQRVNRSGDAVLSRTQEFLAHAAPGALRVGPRIHGASSPADTLVPHLAALAQIDVLLGDAPATPGAEPALPPARAWARLAFRPRHVSDRKAAVQALANATDPSSVILECPATTMIARAPERPAQVTVVERRTQQVRLKVDVGQGRGYLVLGDAFAPGWQATLDGEPVPVLAADVAFRAIAIPEGEHEVELRYRPWSRTLGLPLVALGALLCLVWPIVRRR